MNVIKSMYYLYQKWSKSLTYCSGISLCLLRLYLAPIMMQAGWNKLQHFQDTAAWFGNHDWGLNLPFPELLTSMVIAAELGGGFLLLIGFLTRLVSIPLAITMVVAISTVHWPNGWLAIADASSWFADGTIFTNDVILAAPEKIARATAILQEHGNYAWLTSSGQFVILNNGIEFAATYFVMLLILLCFGGGQYLSLDYWIRHLFIKKLLKPD